VIRTDLRDREWAVLSLVRMVPPLMLISFRSDKSFEDFSAVESLWNAIRQPILVQDESNTWKLKKALSMDLY